MSLFEGIIAFAVVLVGYYISRKFEDKGKEVSDLKEELRQTKRELELKQSSLEWAEGAYDKLLQDYYKVLERYNIPVNWESLEAEEEQEYEDDEDEQMVEIFVKGKDGTRTEKVPAKYVNFKGR